MCGVLPTTVCLVQYTHSSAVTGDHQQVVGYAGLIIS